MRRFFLAIAVTFVVAATVLAVSGGVRTTVGGFRVSARSPIPAATIAVVAGAAWFALARRARSIAADLETWWAAMERHATRIIGVLALVAAIVASAFATRSAAGADASGYLSQAEMWSQGSWLRVEPLASLAGSADGWLTTPLGWVPLGDRDGYQVPTYAPGLPLLLALPHRVGGLDAANAVIVLATAVAVWAVGMLARGPAGIVAAVLVAFTPAFVYQSFQPMSDVPVTAAWMLCFLLLSKPSLAGVACAIAVLIRPNLAPLAVVPLLVAPNRTTFAVPVALAGAFLAFMQWLWYGSAFRSGYGSAEELFALSNVVPNLGRYGQWLVATAPVLLLAPLGFARIRHDRRAVAMGVFALLVIAAYLVYAVFDHWSYLRFLLPAMAVLAIFAGIDLAAWIERWPVSWRAPLLLAVLLGATTFAIFIARSFDTFKLRDQLRRVGQVADYVNSSAPPHAVILSGEQSGAIRYYTHRSILRWDAATPQLLHSSIETLENAGRPVYIALDAWEEEPFRSKFAGVPAVALDWPPIVEAGTSHRTRLWRVSDRAKFLAGAHLPPTTRIP